MITWNTILALIQALPAIIKLFQSLANYAEIKQGEKLGRAEAISEALTIATNEIEEAMKVRIDADAEHQKYNTDDAFDNDFKRNDK